MPESISYQLYSSREFTPWERVVAELAELGYREVEGFPGIYGEREKFKALLNRHGMRMTSAHIPFETLDENYDEALRVAETFEVKQIYCPYLPPSERPLDSEGWKCFARSLGGFAVRLSTKGINLGWHNHDFEFTPCPDGSMPMDIILSEADNISWEADIGWIARAGQSPSEWIKKHGGRITAVHVKDMAPEGERADEDGWTNIGEGTIGWKAMTAELRAAGARLFIMEHDKPGDAGEFARKSIEAFRSY